MAVQADERITIRLPRELRRACQEQAEKERRSVSNWITGVLEQAVPDRKKRPSRRDEQHG